MGFVFLIEKPRYWAHRPLPAPSSNANFSVACWRSVSQPLIHNVQCSLGPQKLASMAIQDTSLVGGRPDPPLWKKGRPVIQFQFKTRDRKFTHPNTSSPAKLGEQA
eukprot:scaffold675_cov103-Cylindrotheca_fusiformis.AAC.6